MVTQVDPKQPPKLSLCLMCDGWYNERDPEQARDHEHPEPQNGELRDHLMRSGMLYEDWALQTDQGAEWLEYVSRPGYICPTNLRLIALGKDRKRGKQQPTALRKPLLDFAEAIDGPWTWSDESNLDALLSREADELRNTLMYDSVEEQRAGCVELAAMALAIWERLR